MSHHAFLLYHHNAMKCDVRYGVYLACFLVFCRLSSSRTLIHDMVGNVLMKVIL